MTILYDDMLNDRGAYNQVDILNVHSTKPSQERVQTDTTHYGKEVERKLTFDLASVLESL